MSYVSTYLSPGVSSVNFFTMSLSRLFASRSSQRLGAGLSEVHIRIVDAPVNRIARLGGGFCLSLASYAEISFSHRAGPVAAIARVVGAAARETEINQNIPTSNKTLRHRIGFLLASR